MTGLTDEEAGNLALAFQAGDRDAAATLLEINQAMVVEIAMRWKRLARWGLERKDLKQWARLGMLKAIATWRPDGGAKLSSYMYRLASHAMIRELRLSGAAVRIPNSARAKGRMDYTRIGMDSLNLSNEPSKEVEDKDEAEYVRRMLATHVQARDQDVLRRVYGIGCEPEDRHQLKARYGTSFMATYHRKNRGLRKLREVMQGKG